MPFEHGFGVGMKLEAADLMDPRYAPTLIFVFSQKIICWLPGFCAWQRWTSVLVVCFAFTSTGGTTRTISGSTASLPTSTRSDGAPWRATRSSDPRQTVALNLDEVIFLLSQNCVLCRCGRGSRSDYIQEDQEELRFEAGKEGAVLGVQWKSTMLWLKSHRFNEAFMILYSVWSTF